jgi:hypothetical protein
MINNVMPRHGCVPTGRHREHHHLAPRAPRRRPKQHQPTIVPIANAIFVLMVNARAVRVLTALRGWVNRARGRSGSAGTMI